MARRELGPAALRVAQAVAAVLPAGEVVVGCSGGADSLALALGASWAGRRSGTAVRAIVVDHRLHPASGEVAEAVRELLSGRGIPTTVAPVTVDTAHPGGLEAAARDARLAALAAPGLPVLLGHTLDDQAETVLLGLLRGSGTRALAGMAPHRPPFLRPLLGLRRTDTINACAEWGVRPWDDPMNADPRFARVAVRGHLRDLADAVGRDVAPALARTAELARADADLLDDLAAAVDVGDDLPVADVAPLPTALRRRVIHRWLTRHTEPTMAHVLAVAALCERWHGQGPVSVPGGRVARRAGTLRFDGAGASGMRAR